MSETPSGKNSKVKVMYVRSQGDDTSHLNPRTGKGRASRQVGGKGRETGAARSAEPYSPWRTVSNATTNEKTAAMSGKPALLDPEVLRRQREEEARVHGERACQALFAHRPEAIVRAWFIQSVTPRFREMLRWLAANRKAYHVVEEHEMQKIAGTEHHGGVCLLIKKRRSVSVDAWLEQPQEQDCVLALTDLKNPQITGAIMRSCSFFGVKGLLVTQSAPLESGTAFRVAEGGAEFIQPVQTTNMAQALETFRQHGYRIVSVISSANDPAPELTRTALPVKSVVLIGDEQGRHPDSLLAPGDIRLNVTGTGHVQGLNQSVLTGIVLATWRQPG